MLEEHEKKPTLLHYWWEHKVENSLKIPLKMKNELPYDPAIPLVGVYPEKIMVPKDACT